MHSLLLGYTQWCVITLYATYSVCLRGKKRGQRMPFKNNLNSVCHTLPGGGVAGALLSGGAENGVDSSNRYCLQVNGDVPSGDVRMFRYCCLTFEVIMDDLPWSGDMKVCVAIVVFLDVIMTAFAVSKQFTLQTTYSLDFEVSSSCLFPTLHCQSRCLHRQTPLPLPHSESLRLTLI